jgi:hypothetical protein
LAAYPDEGLVDVPRPAARAQVAPRALLELRGEALDPAVGADVVDRDAAVGQHPLEVAVADGELQVPPDRPEDDLGREAEAAEDPGRGHERCSRRGMAAGAPLLPARGPPLNATDPSLTLGAVPKLWSLHNHGGFGSEAARVLRPTSAASG